MLEDERLAILTIKQSSFDDESKKFLTLTQGMASLFSTNVELNL